MVDPVLNVTVDTPDVVIDKIENIVPVVYRDDGSDDYWEVVDSSDQMAIIGKDMSGNQVIVIINKESELLLDLI